MPRNPISPSYEGNYGYSRHLKLLISEYWRRKLYHINIRKNLLLMRLLNNPEAFGWVSHFALAKHWWWNLGEENT